MIDVVKFGCHIISENPPENITDEELEAYVKRGRDYYGDNLEGIHLDFDGEYVNIDYYSKTVPFQRIRRITGYLVGDKSRWNDAKSAEEEDRVKHGL